MIFVNFPFLIESERCGTVVKAESVNSFKGRLDRFWNDQESMCMNSIRIIKELAICEMRNAKEQIGN